MSADILPTPTYLPGYEAVVAAFGYWPSFHDAPLLSLEQSDTSLAMLIHADEMTGEVDERGFFGSIKHHLVRFRFSGVRDFALRQFDVPNTLFEIVFSDPAEFSSTGRFTVTLQSVMGGGCDATFTAASGEVSSVMPCDEEGNPA
ncbi:MAG: hypothetical protein QOF24_1377 [Verrucomicrobiota bacterium]|jgi:hypothetical protein